MLPTSDLHATLPNGSRPLAEDILLGELEVNLTGFYGFAVPNAYICCELICLVAGYGEMLITPRKIMF